MPASEEPTIGKLVGDLSKDVSSLISSEIALAKSELNFSARAGGLGIALFAGAAFLLLLAVIMLSVAIVYFIHFSGLDLAWCFLIVFGGYLLIGALLAFLGLKSVKKVRAPERSIAQLQETKAVFRRG
ncbi:MAG: phage holin family protein [Actinomycetota bacterium]|nr:phage holin family protein [Actinomycetota bacterium]